MSKNKSIMVGSLLFASGIAIILLSYSYVMLSAPNAALSAAGLAIGTNPSSAATPPSNTSITHLPPAELAIGTNPSSAAIPPSNTSVTNLPLITMPPVYYVSKSGNNSDGLSWATAWNELDQIRWDVITPGATIFLDGGTTEMVYTTTLKIKKSGTRAAPITIRMPNEAGRNGKVVIFGGRSTPLPYCGQTSYTYQSTTNPPGIDISAQSWVVIDGSKWRGITIYGHNQAGVQINALSNNIIVRNVEIYDNGSAYASAGGWYPQTAGVIFSGTNNMFERAIIHDNGEDAFQSEGGVTNFTVRQSWLYNSRQNPIEPVGYSFNYCAHTDGIQIWNGGQQSGMLIEDSIVGPGFTNGVILGDTPRSDGSYAQLNNVRIVNTLFINAGSNNITASDKIKAVNWHLEHVTLWSVQYFDDNRPTAILLEGSGHGLVDSVIDGCNVYFPDGNEYTSGNFQYHTTNDDVIGTRMDPYFIDAPAFDSYPSLQQQIDSDYSLSTSSPAFGKGARITSVAQLLSQP